MASIICLDMKLSGREGSIEAGMTPYSGGAVLAVTGSGSTKGNWN